MSGYTISYNSYDEFRFKNEKDYLKNGRFEDIKAVYFYNILKFPKLPNKLISLTCVNTNITKIGDLPDTITFMNLTQNKIKYIGKLPKNLNHLNISYNELKTLNIDKLMNLDSLYVNNNNLKYIKFVSSLKNVDISYNKISVIENANMCVDLNVLDCCNNNLTKIVLPNNIEKLYCHHNNLKSMDNLKKIKILDCSHNKLNQLPSLPSILQLYANYNEIIQF
jgi:hypothetical protein